LERHFRSSPWSRLWSRHVRRGWHFRSDSHLQQWTALDEARIRHTPPALRSDIWRRAPHIDILKLDIEGSEKEVFETGYEHWLPKINILIIELHDKMKKGCSRAVFNAISKYDFSFDIKGENIIFTNNAFN
jgi:hypothetical protein